VNNRMIVPGHFQKTWAGFALSIVVTMSCHSKSTDDPMRAGGRNLQFQMAERIRTVCNRQAWTQRCLIPEYTDDQRLTDSLDSYGPYAFTYPAVSLATRNSPTDFTTIGEAVAIIHVDTVAGATLPTTYRVLNLVAEANCVYLKFAAGNWVAFVRAAQPTGTPCPIVGTDPAPAIPVTAIQSTSFPGPQNVPAVARFHEGVRGLGPAQISQPLFGVKCADRWCILTPAGSTPLPSPHAGLNPMQRPWSVPGWGDAQRLAEMSTANPAHVTLGSKRASIIPGPATLFNDSTQFVIGTWYHAATVYFPIEPTAAKYADRWQLRRFGNKIYIRHNGPNDWSARIQRHDGFLCGIIKCWQPLRASRDPHPNLSIPASARFRWFEDDEGVWVRCADGCCTVSAD
jgi:hypothetical protein